MRLCETCDHHKNPQVRMNYSNTDNEAIGWVICGIGNTVKRNTFGCRRHTLRPIIGEVDKALDAQLTAEGLTIEIPKEPHVKRPKKSQSPETPLTPETGEGLLGGVDFEAQLRKGIEEMAARI